MRDVTAICEALAGWAKRWELSAPRLERWVIDMPDAYKPRIRDGWVERPMLEPPANAADEAAVVAATGVALPDDLRALHAVHNGTFAPRLPAGMSMAVCVAVKEHDAGGVDGGDAAGRTQLLTVAPARVHRAQADGQPVALEDQATVGHALRRRSGAEVFAPPSARRRATRYVPVWNRIEPSGSPRGAKPAFCRVSGSPPSLFIRHRPPSNGEHR